MAAGQGSVIAVYLVYIPVAIGLTIWLARTLDRHGLVFLEEVFADRPVLAKAINRLLVIGFYMLNLGYAFVILRARPAHTSVGVVEELATKLGVLLVSLAILHFINVFVFDRIRRRGMRRNTPPPVASTAAWSAPPPPAGQGPAWSPPQ